MAATISSTATRITISGNYKAFTSTTGSTSTVIQYNTGDAPASGDSGRFLMWKNGSNTGDWEIRYIESATSSTVTVGDGGFSSAPASGEDFSISTSLDDVNAATANSVMRKQERSYQMRGRDFELTSNAFLADVNSVLSSKSTHTGSGLITTYPIADNCALQFGRLIGGEANNSVETIEGCGIQFEVSNNTLMFTNQGSPSTTGPILNFYGCHGDSFSNGFITFIRSPGPMRIIGCIMDGPMGGRMYSPATELDSTRFSGNDNGGVAWSLGGTFTRPIDNTFFYQNNTAIKAFQGFQGVFSNTKFADSNTYIIDSSQANSSLLFTFIDCTTFTDAKITNTKGSYKQAKSVKYTLTDSSGAGLTGVKVAIYDNVGAIQDAIKVSSVGIVDQINAVFFDRTHGSTSLNKAPFDIRIRKYDYQYQDFQSAVSEPIKQEFRLPDNTVTVLSEASAGALTGIAINFSLKTLTITASHTLSEIYDYTQSQMALDVNMDEVEFFKSADGNVFTFNDDWDLILNASGDITGASGKTVVFGGTGSLQLNDAGNTVDDLTVTGDTNLGALVTPLTNLNITGTLDFNTAGTYTITDCTINEVTNSSGGAVTLNLDANSTITTNTGPSVTLTYPVDGIQFNNLISGSQVVVFNTGTQTEVFRTNSSSTSELVDISTGTYDYTVMKAGYSPLRVTGIVVSQYSINTIGIQQAPDRAYSLSSGLTFGTTATINTGLEEFAITLNTTVQNWYSFWIEEWINQASLTNTSFPLEPFGSASFSLNDDYEFTPGSLQYLRNDGFRYVNSSGTVTASWCALVSQGISSGLQARFEQESGGTVGSAQNTGNVDQVLQIYGDVTHGNFDYTGYLDFKVQANGYRQAETDVVSVYGTLEENLYVIGLSTLAIDGLTLGDPSPTGLTLTDNSLSPISWDAGDGAKDYSITITDTGSNTGEIILRWLNYNLAQTGSFQGLETFYWPEMVIDNGSAYETIRGTLHMTGGDVLAGVRVIDGSGDPHVDFSRFQADDGTYGTPPTKYTASVTNIVANSRLQIYNVTTATEIYNDIVVGTSYSNLYVEGSDYTSGDTIRVRLTYQSGANAKLGFESITLAGAGWSVLAAQQDDTIYNTIGLDGSTITKFVADYVNDEVDISISNDFTLAEFYAWWVYNTTTSQGISDFFGGVAAVDEANFKINNSIVNIYFDNTTSTNISQTDNRRVYREDGVRPVVSSTSGGGGIDVEWRSSVTIAASEYIQSNLTNILDDTDELQQNQGDWLTATGFDTLTNVKPSIGI